MISLPRSYSIGFSVKNTIHSELNTLNSEELYFVKLKINKIEFFALFT